MRAREVILHGITNGSEMIVRGSENYDSKEGQALNNVILGKEGDILVLDLLKNTAFKIRINGHLLEIQDLGSPKPYITVPRISSLEDLSPHEIILCSLEGEEIEEGGKKMYFCFANAQQQQQTSHASYFMETDEQSEKVVQTTLPTQTTQTTPLPLAVAEEATMNELTIHVLTLTKCVRDLVSTVQAYNVNIAEARTRGWTENTREQELKDMFSDVLYSIKEEVGTHFVFEQSEKTLLHFAHIFGIATLIMDLTSQNVDVDHIDLDGNKASDYSDAICFILEHEPPSVGSVEGGVGGGGGSSGSGGSGGGGGFLSDITNVFSQMSIGSEAKKTKR